MSETIQAADRLRLFLQAQKAPVKPEILFAATDLHLAVARRALWHLIGTGRAIFTPDMRLTITETP